MRKMLTLLLCVCLLMGGSVLPVYAEEAETVFPKVFHVYTSEADTASDEWSTAQKGAYLGNGISSIARAGSNKINISGSTNATQYCDKVWLTLYVERSTSYSTGYSTYKSYYYSAENVYQLVKEVSNITVERGYYYRVYAVHSVKEGSKTETTDSLTNPISFI